MYLVLTDLSIHAVRNVCFLRFIEIFFFSPVCPGCPHLKTLVVENCFVSGSATVFYGFQKLSTLQVVTRKTAVSSRSPAAAASG
jgi:hypothetical protein